MIMRMSAPPRGRRWVLGLLGLAALGLLAGACAGTAHRPARPVSIDARPTPPQPAPGISRGEPATAPRPQALSQTEAAAHARIVADTLAAHAVLERCGRRKMLPEQENTVESARQLLTSTRAAAIQGNLARAESLARQARLLTNSLSCP